MAATQTESHFEDEQGELHNGTGEEKRDEKYYQYREDEDKQDKMYEEQMAYLQRNNYDEYPRYKGPRPPGHRFVAGQAISHQMGPTPTLNQLLQSANPNRYQNNYEYGKEFAWRQMPPYNQAAPVFRPQLQGAPVRCSTVSVPSAGGGGPSYPQPSAASPPPSSSTYAGSGHQPPSPSQPAPANAQYAYPQRYPPPTSAPATGPGPPQTPIRVPAYPATHHQIGSPYGPLNHGPNMQTPHGPSIQPPHGPSIPSPHGPNMQSSHGPNMQPYSEQRLSEQRLSEQRLSEQRLSEQRLSWPPPQHQSPQHQQSQPASPHSAHQQLSAPPSSPRPATSTTPTPHSSASTPQQHSPQSGIVSPQSNHPEPSPQPSPQQHQQQSYGTSRLNLTSTTPEPGDLTSQNSNDSSSGGGPQAMRPTPSPTGSTGSRSMSPAVGQSNIPMPPRPSSGHSDSGSTSSQPRLSHSPMAPSQGAAYQQLLAPPSHVHNYKMGGGGGPQGAALHQNSSGGMISNPTGAASGPPYPSQLPPSHQPYPQQSGGYPGRGGIPPYSYQNYGMQQGHSQYPVRPLPNHVAPHSQMGFQGWPAASTASASPSKVTPPSSSPQQSSSPQPPSHHPLHHLQQQQQQLQQQQQQSPRMSNCAPGSTHTPPQYLKQHLQHKVGAFNANNMPPSPGSSGVYGNGQPSHHHMGPPVPGHHHHSNSHHDGPMPPPSSTPNSHSASVQSDSSMDSLHEGGTLTTIASSAITNVSQTNSGGITSVIGPDGILDEASQQSTLSNTSCASGEDPSSTPKRKESGMGIMPIGGYLGHSHQGPMTPCSPGMNSMPDDYPPEPNPPWTRTPSSPVLNCHMPQDMYRPKKHDSLSKLYEMDDNPERRVWLDKLLHFMDDRGTPISTCPTISKNPLDLFRLYVYVKERGGFMEVTKNKIWKDIAGLLGIGASSSAAYTLRKHYTKNLLPYECHYDRGGIDPQPIINQVESTSKKKNAKQPASVPSPGNSQDSYPGSGMDGYGYGYGSPDYANSQRGPPMQNHQSLSSQSGGYQGQPGYSQYPPEQYNQQYLGSGSYPQSRPMYSGYPPDPERGYSGGSSGPIPMGGAPPTSSASNSSSGPPPPQQQPPPSDPYSRSYPPPPPHGYHSTRPPPQQQQPPASTPPPHVAPSPPRPDSQPSPSPYPASPQPSTTPQPPQTAPSPQPASQPSQPPAARTPPSHQNSQPPAATPHEYYRNEQQFSNQNQIPSAGSNSFPGGSGPNKGMPPVPQPRRHPDFSKEGQPPPPQQPPSSYSTYNNQPPQRPMFTGWPNENANRGQYGPRGPYPPGPPPQQQPPGNAPPPSWGPGPPPMAPRPAVPPGAPQQPPNAQWDQHRYPPNSQQAAFPPPPQGNQWNLNSANASNPPNATVRPGWPSFRNEVKPFQPIQPSKLPQPGTPFVSTPSPVPPQGSACATLAGTKREPSFPLESVEAVSPVLVKRRRLTRSDVAPVDAWRLLMSLRSGLLAESCWALDVLNTLLFDEHAVQYFGLAHMPGLLDTLLEHFDRSLADMLEAYADGERAHQRPTPCWYERQRDDAPEPDLGRVSNPAGERVPIVGLPDYTFRSRKGMSVTVVDGSEELFVEEGPRDWEDRPVELEDAVEPDTRYIVACFRAQFGLVPFVRLLPGARTHTDHHTNHRIKQEERAEPKSGRPSAWTLERVSLESWHEDRDSEEVPRDWRGVWSERHEDECYTRDEASLYLVSDTQDAVARRCLCLSTILRNLTFVPGNEYEFAKCGSYLKLMGKLLLVHHRHPLRARKQQNYDREEDSDFAECCTSLRPEPEWWWEWVHAVRENVLVSIANIAGQLDLSGYEEEVTRPVLDGLLHWAVCPAAQGQDPFPTAPSLSPQRLALEALCKLCVTEANVDLVMATPPYDRLERLTGVLTRLLCRSEEQVLREFAINLLHYLSAAASSMARVIALQSPCVSLLVAFIEQAEQSALSVANQLGFNALRDNPDSMGTSLDMLRRAARTLLHLARHPDNRPLFMHHEQRLLALVMSQILDQQVAGIISQVLFQCSRESEQISTTSTAASTNSTTMTATSIAAS